jgi:hypothetical protein
MLIIKGICIHQLLSSHSTLKKLTSDHKKVTITTCPIALLAIGVAHIKTG